MELKMVMLLEKVVHEEDGDYVTDEIEYDDLHDEDKQLVQDEMQDRVDLFMDDGPFDHPILDGPFRYLMSKGGTVTIRDNMVIFRVPTSKFRVSKVLSSFDSEIVSGYFNNDAVDGIELSTGYHLIIFDNAMVDQLEETSSD